jgi:tripartite-type tricarboxylate transporter receptor subunit TctC
MLARVLFVVVGLALLGVAAVAAQDYPTKVITLVVPFAAGGPTDTVARLVAQAMGGTLKQQIIVENVGGAGGTIASNRVAKAPPDGYTLLIHHIGMSTTPALYRKLPYNTLTDFSAPSAQLCSRWRRWRCAPCSSPRSARLCKRPSAKAPAEPASRIAEAS